LKGVLNMKNNGICATPLFFLLAFFLSLVALFLPAISRGLAQAKAIEFANTHDVGIPYNLMHNPTGLVSHVKEVICIREKMLNGGLSKDTGVEKQR
jgi:hypothetical protein